MDGEISESAQRELLLHYKEIRSAISDCVRCPQLADDLAQETFCRAFSAIARKNRVRNTAAWLHAIARNVVRDHGNRIRRHPLMEPSDFEQFIDEQQADRVAEEAPCDIERLALGRALDSLRPLARAIIIAFYFQGKDCVTIGAELGLDRRTVNYRLYHARRRLRRLIQLRGGAS